MRSIGSTYPQTLLLPALIACALLTTLASCGKLSYEPNSDRKDGAVNFEVTDLEHCIQDCQLSWTCVGYTWVKSDQTCWLQSSIPVPQRRTDDCCISGVKGGWRNGPYSSGVQGENSASIKLDRSPASSHVCVLTSVGGEFRGGGEIVGVKVHDDDNFWHLELVSHAESGVEGTAYCFRKDAFHANGTDRVISPNPPFEAQAGDGGGGTDTWNGDAATFLAGVSGNFRGGDEHARIVQSSDPATPSKLALGASSDYLRAWAYSFFAGTWHAAPPAKFFQDTQFDLDHVNIGTPNPDRATLATTGDPAFPPSTTDAMCYLTRVQGEFDGTGEWIEIYPIFDSDIGAERWEFFANGSGDAELFASARCYLKDQR